MRSRTLLQQFRICVEDHILWKQDGIRDGGRIVGPGSLEVCQRLETGRRFWVKEEEADGKDPGRDVSSFNSERQIHGLRRSSRSFPIEFRTILPVSHAGGPCFWSTPCWCSGAVRSPVRYDMLEVVTPIAKFVQFGQGGESCTDFFFESDRILAKY